MSTRPPRGRRPGDARAKEAILDAARRQFAELGYDRASLRRIAADAEVDAALVSHYFGSKQQLFAAAAPFPMDPEEVLADLLGGPRETIGQRLAQHVLRLTENTEGRQKLTGLMRAAASEEAAARMVRDRITGAMLLPLAKGLDAPQAELRAALAASQMVGLIMARHVVGVQPLLDSGTDVLVAAIGPVLQRYLTEPIAGMD
ncbi:TetR family transcriptional regulator [Streptomyces spinosirectus]|jgi:AcrR family transcriptional regulator|uniref:TetR/AcrR family transcriptional regulator n=1 Tax=Streptomyces TaxID=1883 RepID=UPI000D343F44|nr:MULTISPECIES: TetR family transcriptional regulator [Streptomyces]MBY8338551.1 TetR family transcriptional regulator [Streptomyces plumbidurans]PTM96871.1 TetR family transcriptional regulator [Streptomyces sp. VMFN-G11Ma]UIR16431.1 TetR family transcriptional regulator [Streptomyces spinosirectus]